MDQNQTNAAVKEWLAGLRDYEKSIRNKPVKQLCNRHDVEQLRYDLRVLLDYIEAQTPSETE